MQKAEQGRTGELIPIFTKLEELIAKQKTELETIKFPQAFGMPELIFKWYLRSDRFKSAYQEAIKFCLMPHNLRECDLNASDFSGRLFEDIAYYVLSKKQLDEGRILLSPERTLDFWKRLYPKDNELCSPYGSGSLAGKSVPDGIVVEKFGEGNKILTLCEYTLSEKAKLDIKREGNKKDILLYPNFLVQVSFLYVLPQGVLNEPNTLRLPFSAPDFRTFFNYVCKNYPEDEEVASLNDIQRKSQKQFSKVLAKSKGGMLTEEDEVYLGKIALSPGII